MADLRGAFDRTVEANTEVMSELDAAVVESGRAIADHIDSGADGSIFMVPHLMNVLREMYATPKSRRDAGLGQEEARGKLAEVRDLRKRPAPTKKRAAN